MKKNMQNATATATALYAAPGVSRLTGAFARHVARLGAVVLLGALGACSVSNLGPAPHASRTDDWTILPIANNTETPQAGLRAASIAEGLLSAEGFTHLKRYPASADDETLFDPAKADIQQKALDWARGEHIRYALTGSVNEWRYKVGVDGEPAVGMTLQLIDVPTGNVIWSGTGSRTGWSRDALSGVAQKLERQLLSPLAR